MDEYETLSKEIKHGTRELKIIYDPDPINPRTWDNLGLMVCLHRRYDLGDKHSFRDSEDIREYMKENKIKSFLPLYLYDHSGITINTTGFNCLWDSGQIGFTYVTKKDVRKCFSKKRISSKLYKQVTRILKSEIETYDQYLRNDIYGFILYKTSKCDHGYEHKTEINSCWGFYGDNFNENGLFHQIDQNIEEWDRI